MISYILREATQEDENFIFNSFLQSYRKYSSMRYVPHNLYFKPQSDIISYLLDTANILIACFPEEPDQIMGYVIYEHVNNQLVLHYEYIKNIFRSERLDEALLTAINPKKELMIITHLLGKLEMEDNTITYKQPYNVAYDPFFITNKRLLECHE